MHFKIQIDIFYIAPKVAVFIYVPQNFLFLKFLRFKILIQLH